MDQTEEIRDRGSDRGYQRPWVRRGEISDRGSYGRRSVILGQTEEINDRGSDKGDQ